MRHRRLLFSPDADDLQSLHHLLSFVSSRRLAAPQGGGVPSIYIWPDGREACSLSRTGRKMGRQPGARDDGGLVSDDTLGGRLQEQQTIENLVTAIGHRTASHFDLVRDLGKGSDLHLGELTTRARTAQNIQICRINEQGN